MTQAEVLLAIAQRDGGKITPAAVLNEARNPESILHNAFTWDDTVAAEKWRTYEAQKLIRECKITITKPDGESVKTYAFIGLSSDRTESSSNNPYRIAEHVAKSDDLLSTAIQDTIAQLKAFKKRYNHLVALKPVWDAIDAL